MKIFIIKIEAMLFMVSLIVVVGFGAISALRDDVPIDVRRWMVFLSVIIVAINLIIGIVTNRKYREISKKAENE